MADCLEKELSVPFQRIVDIVKRHYNEEIRDIDEINRKVNKSLWRLRSDLDQLVPARSSTNDVYFTCDLVETMLGTDIYHMMNASPGLQDFSTLGVINNYDDLLAEQQQVAVSESTAAGPGMPTDTITLPPHQTAADKDKPAPCTATNDVILRDLASKTSSMPAISQSSSHSNAQHATKSTNEQVRRQTDNQRKSRVMSKHRTAKSTRPKVSPNSTLYPTDKSIPGVRDLLRLLSPKHATDAIMLAYTFAEIVTLNTFSQFANSLQFFYAHKQIRLPRRSHSLAPLMDVLEQIESGSSLLCLCRSVGLLRVRSHFAKVERRIAATGSAQGNLRRSAASRTYDLLAREARASGHLEEAEAKTRKRIRNHVAAGRVWLILDTDMGSGVLAFLPRIAPSTFERMSSSALKIFIRFLQENARSEVLFLIKILSDHLPAILEGDECTLARVIAGGTAESWHHLLVIIPDLEPCLHPVTRR